MFLLDDHSVPCGPSQPPTTRCTRTGVHNMCRQSMQSRLGGLALEARGTCICLSHYLPCTANRFISCTPYACRPPCALLDMPTLTSLIVSLSIADERFSRRPWHPAAIQHCVHVDTRKPGRRCVQLRLTMSS